MMRICEVDSQLFFFLLQFDAMASPKLTSLCARQIGCVWKKFKKCFTGLYRGKREIITTLRRHSTAHSGQRQTYVARTHIQPCLPQAIRGGYAHFMYAHIHAQPTTCAGILIPRFVSIPLLIHCAYVRLMYSCLEVFVPLLEL